MDARLTTVTARTAMNAIPDLPASKGRGRQKELNRIYAYPLPILFSPSDPSSSRVPHVGLFASWQSRVENPQCEGIFDPYTRSVWVVNSAHSMLLWQRGFFGKGSLSRSEPSWLVRRIHEQQQKAKKGASTLH
jgi:tRNA-splicing endonuclease subunit Sen2